MRKLTFASFIATTMLAVPAWAQTSAPEAAPGQEAPSASGTTPMPSDGTQPRVGSTAEATPDAAGQGGFITYQQGTQMLGSGLMGAKVRGPDNEDIGTVDDLLLSNSGQVEAVIVGVGGFLGVGTKDVAIAIDQLNFAMAQDTQADADGAAEPAVPSGSTTMAPATPPAATGTAEQSVTATPATGTGTAAVGDGWGWNGAGIDHISVSYTREQLEEAPEFEAAE